jgi:two-component system sensor histidine kinase UhpB
LALSYHLRHLPPDSGELRGELENYREQVNAIIEKVRAIVRELGSSDLEHVGLAIAITSLVEELQKFQDIKVSLEIDDIRGMFALEKKIIIFRIFQEILSNIAKHANPTQVCLSIKRQNSRVIFQIKDNGAGFDVQSMPATKRGTGLMYMEVRVRMLGGSLEIWSQPGQGTRTEFIIPISGSDAVN